MKLPLPRVVLSVFSLAGLIWLVPVHAQSSSVLKTGEQVYLESCKVCHGGGVAGAPALGKRKAWTPLIAEGQVPLTVTAWMGIRAMPPKGGREDLGLDEFARATAWMAREAGAKWSDPDAVLLKRMRELEEKRLAARSKRQPRPGS